MAKVDIERLEALVASGHIATQAHHDNPRLRIWNYTNLAQFERHWTPETLMCRGLITWDDGTIVARPFSKFFNVEQLNDEELAPLRYGPVEITTKMDGSLGILHWLDDAPYIATRGSFASEQAIHATAVFRDRYWHAYEWSQAHTYLFEIVYPSNRIVVDYGSTNDLFLLAVIHTETGHEIPLRIMRGRVPCPVTKVYSGDSLSDLDRLRADGGDNEEGFVARSENSGLRVKAKYAEYVRLHRIMTNCNARIIWEAVRDGTLDKMLDRVPDEFYAWVKSTLDDMRERTMIIEREAQAVFMQVSSLPTRKEQALAIKATGYEHPRIVFNLLDGDTERAEREAWNIVRPSGASRPFKVDEEG